MSVTAQPDVTADVTRAAGVSAGALPRVLRRHWAIAVVLAAGAALRTVVMLAYVPFFWFTDSTHYLRFAALVRPDGVRPWGYSGFLWLALHVFDRRGVVALQHALVLALAAVLYAFLIHRRVRPWLAALAVVPLSLSPLVVNVEHHLLADWLFVILFTAAALLPAWSEARPAVSSCALAGLALAGAIVTRQVALAAVAPLVAYLVLRRGGVVRIGAFLVALALPVLGYLSWMHSTHGVYALTTWSGKMLYARVAPIARCDRLGHLTPQERQLCDPRPVSRRPGPDAYLWTGGKGPQRHLPDRVVLSFARKVIVHQPLTYLRLVAGQTAEIFYPGRRQRSGEACVAYWTYPDPRPGGCRTDRVGTRIWRRHGFSVDRPLAAGLHVYERVDSPIGPLLLACLAVTVLACAWRPRLGGWRLRLDAGLLALVGLVLTVGAIATANFSYRYTLPLYSTVPIAAALALTQLTRREARA